MTNIEWTEKTWNPIVGCSITTPGCTNCYAMRMAARIQSMNAGLRAGHGAADHYAGTTRQANGKQVWTGKLALAPEETLLEPLKRKKPTVYFVNSMSDLFHEDAPDEWIDKVFSVMALAPHHTFQVLTKRAERMRQYFGSGRPTAVGMMALDIVLRDHLVNEQSTLGAGITLTGDIPHLKNWPLPNVWLGVSTERQQEADLRIPYLLATPASVRFISAEPLLGPINLDRIHEFIEYPEGGRADFWESALSGKRFDIWAGDDEDPMRPGHPKLDWVIVGGESGNAARPMHPAWATSLRDQCAVAGVPFFFKQWGEFAPSFPRQSQERCASKQANIAWPDGTIAYGSAAEHGGIGIHLDRMGKARAGRLLEGVQHDGWPAAAP